MPRLEASLSPVMAELFDRCRRDGFDVSWSAAEEWCFRPASLRPTHDLYLLKSQAPAALSLAAVLHAQGADILNSWPSCAAAQDKVVATHRLHAFGVPLPATWAAARPAELFDVVDSAPLVLKPFDGYHGTGVEFLDSPADLLGREGSDRPAIVQQRVEGRADLKVYVIGDDVFGVRKSFDPTSHGRAGTPTCVDSDVRDIALRCGTAFGLGLYGVDIVESTNGPVVIDVNHFPGYKGVPDAAERLHAHLLGHLEAPLPAGLPPLPAVARTGAA